VFWFGFGVPRWLLAVSLVFLLGFALSGLFVVVGVVFRACLPNITLKRDAPYRGGFEGLLFFRLRWLRQSSVTGAPLSFTLGGSWLSDFLRVGFGLPSSASVVAVMSGLGTFVYCQPCVCVMRGVASGVLVWLRCTAHDASREFSVCLVSGVLFSFFVLGCLVSSCCLPNITLKRDAPYRGGFGGLLFF
jgi:hypothetical protein